jgi:hypothetical protein
MKTTATTVEVPMEMASWLLDYFYHKPMNESEQVVYALRQVISVANDKLNNPAAGEDEATVSQPS